MYGAILAAALIGQCPNGQCAVPLRPVPVVSRVVTRVVERPNVRRVVTRVHSRPVVRGIFARRPVRSFLFGRRCCR